jgi:predicted phage terminase large subunit-like protein
MLLNGLMNNLDEIEKALAREDYSVYLEYVHHGRYIPSRHSDLVCQYLEKVERGEIRRLMIFMPPRHSKSMTVTETFPSWFIGRNPERRVIEVSYGDSLARKFGKANRNKIAEFGEELFGITLARDNSSVTNWDIEGHRGGMISVGIGGGITGQGADLLIIDDPIKNRKEADSETYREMLWAEWKDTLSTRLQPGGRVILILTRWHEDDLAGRLLKHEPDKWTVLSLPAVCESEDDPLGRKIGEALWPEYGFDEKWAEETKRSVGSRTWSALYQQRPSPAEGSMFKRSWWKYYRALPARFDEVIQSWDCAFKDNKDSDYVVGQVWGRIGANKYLIDQVRGQMDFPTTIQAIRNLSARYPSAYAKLIEDKANGTAVIQTLRNEIPGIIAVNPDGGKVARAASASADAEAGNIYLPAPEIAPWVHDFVEECASFPNGANDDQVDAFTQAMNRFNNKPRPSIRSL